MEVHRSIFGQFGVPKGTQKSTIWGEALWLLSLLEPTWEHFRLQTALLGILALFFLHSGSIFGCPGLHFGLIFTVFSTFLVIACLSFVSYLFNDFWSVLLVLWFALCLACLFLGWVVWLVAVSVVSVVGVVGAARAVGVAGVSGAAAGVVGDGVAGSFVFLCFGWLVVLDWVGLGWNWLG